MAYSPELFAAPEPEIAFEFQEKDRVETVNLIGENSRYAVITNKSKIFVYDSENGEKLWEAAVDDFSSNALEIVWDNKYFITSRKKGMICYNILNGEILWRTTTELKMKNFVQYHRFDKLFVLEMRKVFIAIDTENGNILWTFEKDEGFPKLLEIDKDVVYCFEGDYGRRILQLGKKNVTLIDANTGITIASLPMKWSEKTDVHVKGLKNNSIGLFHKDGTLFISLTDGHIITELPNIVDYNFDFKMFHHEEKYYALVNGTETTVLIDFSNGERKWELPDIHGISFKHLRLAEDNTLLVFGSTLYDEKNPDLPNRGRQCYAYALDFETGEPKWGPTYLGFSKTDYSIWIEKIYEHQDGLLIYLYGDKTYKTSQDPSVLWDMEGGEGLLLLNPTDGKILWTSHFSMYNNWLDGQKGALVFDSFRQDRRNGKFSELGSPNWDDLLPEPIFDGNFAYCQGNGGWVKVDISSGELIWQVPDIPFSTNVHLKNGRLFGNVGFTQRSFLAMSDFNTKEEINTTKKIGYFIIDTESGELVYNAEKLKKSLNLQYEYYDESRNVLYLSDGDYFRKMNVNTGEFDWEIRLKKELTGSISAEEGVAYSPSFYRYSESNSGIRMSLADEEKFDFSMEHGIQLLDNGNFLVLAQKGPAVLTPDGEIEWTLEWKWDHKNIAFTPKILKNGLLYQYKNKLCNYSLKDGSLLWQSQEIKKADYLFYPDLSKVMIVKKKSSSVFKI